MKLHPCILCAGSGTLLGVHLAGACEGLQEEEEFRRSLRAVHASSAGVPSTLFYVLARTAEETTRGADIYTEDLTGNRFLNLGKIPDMVMHRLRLLLQEITGNLLPPPKRTAQVVNVPYLMKILEQKLPSDFTERLRQVPYPYYAHVFNREEGRVERVLLNEAADPLKVVHDSISAIPGYYPPRSQRYVDAAVAEGFFDHEELRKMYPGEKIVYIANYPPLDGTLARFTEWLVHRVYGVLSIPDRIGPGVFRECFQRMQEQMDAIRADINALLVHARKRFSLSETTKLNVLQTLRAEGRQQARKILRFLAA